MAINLDTPKKFRPLVGQAHQVAMNMLRPISRRYDRAEHAYPHELDMLAAMIDGLRIQALMDPDPDVLPLLEVFMRLIATPSVDPEPPV